jgi:hypothetical protein
MKKNRNYYFRIIHRYLGFYLAGIMAVYAISGVTLIFRKGDAFKKNVTEIVQLKPQLDSEKLGSELKIKDLNYIKTEGEIYFFEQGQYNFNSGEARYTVKKIPFVLDKMQKLHKATTKSPVYWLNVFFGISLLFFVISAFWMFLPSTAVFKKGVYFSLLGIIMTVIILFI